MRMQGLDVKAGAEDIREFFKDLYIPNGGVYILGGQLKEAFIAFGTERHAQLAMRRSGQPLKRSTVNLYISSMEELEHRLKLLLKEKTKPLTIKGSQPHPPADSENGTPLHDHVAQPGAASSQLAEFDDPDPPMINSNSQSNQTAQPLDSSTAFILGVCTVLQGIQASQTTAPNIDFSQGERKDVFSVVRRKPDTSSKPGYVRLFGLPASTTKEEICIFFKGLAVEEVITNVKLGCKVGCLVKFAQKQDASDALCFNQRPLGSHCVEVRAADEKLWAAFLQECENACNVEPQQHFSSLSSHFLKKETTDLCSFEKPRSNSGSENVLSLPKEHIVMVSNLPKTITKTELKNFFSCPNLPHKNVLHLLDRSRNITDTAFFIFDSFKDFEYAINLSGCHFGSRTIKVSTITRKMMTEMMAETNPKNKRPAPIEKRPNKRKFWPDEGEVSKVHQSQAARLCLFVRNMPAGVQKSQIKAFFSKHNFEVKDIRMVCGEDGKSIGEAVLKLESEKIAMLAQELNGEDFLGEKLLLTCISVKQMEDIVPKI